MNKMIKIALALLFACAFVNSAYAQTEFGIQDDLTVLGTDGDIADPDVEVAGFTVFGTTTSAIMYADGAGDVAIGGDLQVDTTAYFVGQSSFTSGPASIFVQGGSDGQVMTYDSATGALEWTNVSALGDNLGNHIATEDLDMNSWNIINVSSISFLSGVEISSASAALGGGIFISTHAYINNNLYVAENVEITGTLTVDGNTQLGDGATDDHGINIAVEDGIALKIQGDTGGGATALETIGGAASGDYIAKFYSGGTMAAWIRTK